MHSSLSHLVRELPCVLSVAHGHVVHDYLAIFLFNEHDDFIKLHCCMGVDIIGECSPADAQQLFRQLLAAIEEQKADSIVTFSIGRDPILQVIQQLFDIVAESHGVKVLGSLHTQEIKAGETITGGFQIEDAPEIDVQQIPIEDSDAYHDAQNRDPNFTGLWPNSNSNDFDDALRKEFPGN